MLSSYILYHLQDIWVKLQKCSIDLYCTCSSFCFGSHPNSQYNQIRPKSQVPSTKPTSYKTHPIKAVVERTFAGKTTCNSIPRLGGLKVFWKSQVFSTRKTPPLLWWFFIWGWTSQDGFVDFCEDYIFVWELLRYIWLSPTLFFGVSFFFGKGGTTRIWKTGLRNP